MALLVLGVKDPPRGAHDAPMVGRASARPLDTYLDLLRNKRYLLTALGYGAYTFALGGLGLWMPAFLERIRGMSHVEATATFGAITCATGFAGTFIGGWLGDRLLRRTKQSYLWVSGVATFVAAPVTWLALANANRMIYLPAIIVAEVLIFMCTGPINSAILSEVKPIERATAMGLAVFIMHLVGDIPSQPLIGYLSDRSTLAQGILVVPVAVVLAGVLWVVAARVRDPVSS